MPCRYLTGALTNPLHFLHSPPSPRHQSARPFAKYYPLAEALYSAALKFPVRFPRLPLIAACFDLAQGIPNSRLLIKVESNTPVTPGVTPDTQRR